MSKIFKNFFLAFFVLTSSMLMSCKGSDASGNDYQTLELFAMDTVISIKAYGENAQAALSVAEQEILRLEKLFSVTDANSEVYKLNTEKRLEASNEFFQLISSSLDISAETDGAFDISVYPLVRLYGFTTGGYRVPAQDEIDSALRYVGYEHIFIQGDKIEIPSGASVDLGAIAKGYCGDRIAEILQKNGVSSAIISLGGNVRLVGKKPDESDYSIAISDPNNTGGYIGYVSTSDCSVVTSGSYQRYFEENGIIYHHIIDPKTGYCANNGLLSVTIVCGNGAYADALSTALFVLGEERAVEYCRTNPEISAIFVDNQGEVSIIGNVEFTPDEAGEYTYSTLK